MLTELFTNLRDVGIAVLVIALISIFLVGCFKLIPGLKNMNSKVGRKAIYFSLSLVISGGLAVIYWIFIQEGGWDMDLLSFVVSTIATVNIIYPIYENTGLRDLLKKIVSLLIPSKKTEVSQVIDSVSASLGSEVETLPTSAEVKEKQEKSEKTGWLE